MYANIWSDGVFLFSTQNNKSPSYPFKQTYEIAKPVSSSFLNLIKGRGLCLLGRLNQGRWLQAIIPTIVHLRFWLTFSAVHEAH